MDLEETLMNSDLGTLLKAIQSLTELEDDMLTDEMIGTMKNNIKEQFAPSIVSQSVNQIINNLEEQGLTKAEANNAMQSLITVLKEVVYGEELVGNKKIIVDEVMNNLFSIFEQAINKYHSYAIDLPLTIEENAKTPTYAHESDAAADLYALETVTLEGHSLSNKIRTGVKIQLPEGWLAMILPRSSMGAKTPLRLSNSVGLIDSGYRGELGVLYDNISDSQYTINAGDRIAQLLVMPSYRFRANVVDTLEDSDRGETGFGDSGK